MSNTPQRSSFTNHDDLAAKDDRTAVRDRHSRDGQRIERDGEKRDSRSGATQNRRSVKDDSDLWSNARQQRHHVHDNQERTHQKNGDRDYDRDREGGREHRGQRGFENHRRDADADVDGGPASRRNGHPKGRNEPPWNREEGRNQDGHEDLESARPRDWRDKERRGTRGPERDWNRSGRVEMDPEWMDEPEPEIKEQKRTQEDFERWKERMKASNGTTQELPLSSVEQRSGHDRNVPGFGTGVAKAKVETPLIVDPSFDGFFGLWDKPTKVEEVVGTTAEPNIANTAVKMSKPSKFTGFFAPKADPEPAKEQLPLPLFAPSKDSSNEDKEGFQRILKLLDQQQTQGGKGETAPRAQGQRDTPASPTFQSRGVAERSDFYNLLGARSSQENTAPPTKDSEFLLRLMQQPQHNRQDINQGNIGGRRPAQDTAPGLLPLANVRISPFDTPNQTPSSGFSSGFFSGDEMQSRDKLNPTSGAAGAERRGPPPGIYDQHQSPAGGLQQSGFPSGLQRPPGLEQQLPPGYAQHLLSHRQNMIPPPGFQAPARGQNGFPPGLNPSNPNDRLQYGMPSINRGMGPSSFMGMSAPPPGFPIPFNSESIQFGGFGDAASFGHGGQGFMPGQQRR